MTNLNQTTHEPILEVKPIGFYDDAYWLEGEGQLLWNMRKLLAFITEVSGPETPPPFLTTMHKGDDDPTWVGWYASWNETSNNSLYLEYEGTAFCIYAIDATNKKSVMKFWYNFGDTSDKNSNSWDELEDAVVAARAWLQDNHANLATNKNSSLRQEFNI
jgi:hypothetical protein